MTLEATTQLHFLSLGMSSLSSHGKVQWSLPTSHPPLPVCSSCNTDYPLSCPPLGFGALNSPNSISLSNYPFMLLSKVVLLLEFLLQLHPEKSKTCTLALSFFLIWPALLAGKWIFSLQWFTSTSNSTCRKVSSLCLLGFSSLLSVNVVKITLVQNFNVIFSYSWSLPALSPALSPSSPFPSHSVLSHVHSCTAS